MSEMIREQYVNFVFKYQQELPLKRIRNSEFFTFNEIANFSDKMLHDCYLEITKRLKIIAGLTKKSETVSKEYSDSMEQYLIDTYMEDNGIDEEPTLYHENFLGPIGPDERENILNLIRH